MAKFHFLSSSLIFIHCFILSHALIVRNLATDQQALLQFKHQIDDTANILADNWTTAHSVCNWIGVSCAAKHSRIRALNLAEMNLTGTIPPQLGNLTFLVSLDLSGNGFHGAIPHEISNLSKLRTLRLASNKLSGPIPTSIYNISSLRTIWLYSNSLSGNIPDQLCRHLPNLETLYLDENGLSGQIPTSIGECRNLQHLTLYSNRLSGRIPSSIWNLTTLKELNLNFNNIEGEIPSEIENLVNLELFSVMNMSLTGRIPKSIGNLTKLTDLYLGPNNIEGEIPREIANLHSLEIFAAPNMSLTGTIPPILNITSLRIIFLYLNHLSGEVADVSPVSNLEEIHLWGNNLTGNVLESISNCSKLTKIAVMANLFSGNIPNNIGNLEFLQELRIWTNNFTAEIDSNGEWTFFSTLRNSKSLRILELSKNPLHGVLPTSISNLSATLEIFSVVNCSVGGTIPMEIGTLINATMIQLGFNRFVGSVPPSVGRLENLQLLSLTGNKLQGPIPHELCDLKGLYELSLDDNQFDGPIPACFGELRFLRNLYLSSNKLHSPIPSTLLDLKYILQVDLSSNYLNGSLPTEIGNLMVLQYLDLSRNRLSDEIPSTIGQLHDLQDLFLSSNGFRGPIPPSLGDAVSLQTLDLSGNNLSGAIPKSLEKLHDLHDFNVSLNRLEGEIPRGGPFSIFTHESFLNNYALCGSPRLQVSPCKTNLHRNSKKTLLRVLRYVLPIFASIIIAFTCIIVCIILKKKRKAKKKGFVEDPNPLKEWKRISYGQLSKGTDGFSGENMVGSGGFGTVYKGILSDGTEVAIKVFNLQTEGAFRSFDVECKVMSKIIHRNLVKVITCCSATDFKALVFEFMPNGSLEKWLYSDNHTLDILQRINIMIDVALALEYLHSGYSTPIIHCDLKPSNVLLDKDMVARVGDFGIAKLLGEADSFKQTVTLATIGYMAPEYGTAGIISVKSDVYSYGILLMETFTRKKPTDENFGEGMSLKHWVEKSQSNGFLGAGDSSLVQEDDRYFVVKANCISSILRLALDCSAVLPEDRTDMKNVGSILNHIKRKFLSDLAED